MAYLRSSAIAEACRKPYEGPGVYCPSRRGLPRSRRICPARTRRNRCSMRCANSGMMSASTRAQRQLRVRRPRNGTTSASCDNAISTISTRSNGMVRCSTKSKLGRYGHDQSLPRRRLLCRSCAMDADLGVHLRKFHQRHRRDLCLSRRFPEPGRRVLLYRSVAKRGDT
jgi:hypothetical protein